MKKILMMCAMVAAAWAAAADGPIPHIGPYKQVVYGIEWTFMVPNGEVSLGAWRPSATAIPTNTAGAIVIPAELVGCPVTEVGEYAFANCRGLTSVKIPSGVTRIGQEAFRDCSGLTSVTIPASVESIGENAFSGDGNLACVYVDRGSAPRIRELIEESGFDTGGVLFVEGEAPEESFDEPHTFNGLVRLGDTTCGIIQVTTGKESKKGVKVGGFVMLTDGKKQTIKSVTETNAGGTLYVETTAGKLGEVVLTVTEDGFTGSVGLMTVASGEVVEETGIISGTLKMSYFDAKTNKLKTKSLKIGGVAVGDEAAGTIDAKGEGSRTFDATIK